MIELISFLIDGATGYMNNKSDDFRMGYSQFSECS